LRRRTLRRRARCGTSQFGMIDAVVADILLPDGNALDIVAQFREERPELQVVTMSGGVHASARRVRLRSDDLFLPKPFAPGTLVNAITAAAQPDEVWAKN
jgi:DNA-binding NarL/FixJ family response regulator